MEWLIHVAHCEYCRKQEVGWRFVCMDCVRRYQASRRRRREARILFGSPRRIEKAIKRGLLSPNYLDLWFEG
jgi:hypothetical protein